MSEDHRDLNQTPVPHAPEASETPAPQPGTSETQPTHQEAGDAGAPQQEASGTRAGQQKASYLAVPQQDASATPAVHPEPSFVAPQQQGASDAGVGQQEAGFAADQQQDARSTAAVQPESSSVSLPQQGASDAGVGREAGFAGEQRQGVSGAPVVRPESGFVASPQQGASDTWVGRYEAGFAAGSVQGAGGVSARRAPWWLVGVLLVVAVGVGFGGGALLWAGEGERGSSGGDSGVSSEQYEKCLRQVTVFFSGTDPDPAMRAAGEELRGDGRFESVREETRAEAYENFKEIFADQPELVELARPEAMPAAVYLVVRKGSTGEGVQMDLQQQFPDADEVTVPFCVPPRR